MRPTMSELRERALLLAVGRREAWKRLARSRRDNDRVPAKLSRHRVRSLRAYLAEKNAKEAAR
jgi:hypothetical protein